MNDRRCVIREQLAIKTQLEASVVTRWQHWQNIVVESLRTADDVHVMKGYKMDRQTETDCGGESLAACFIETTLANVPHPLDHIMVTVVEFGLKHLQIAHFETRRSKRHLSIKRTVTDHLPYTATSDRKQEETELLM